MNYTIEGGSLPVLICKLNAGESILSQAGGRTWMKGNITTDNTTEGGVKKGLGRMLSGEKLFMSRYTANGDCEIAFASSFPGTIVARELGKGESLICQKKAFLASTEEVELSMHLQKKVGKGLFGGEGFVMQKVTGPGMVFLEFDGHCVEYDLAPGERMVCDTGVVAAMEETCGYEIQSIKGLKNIIFGGEGLFETVVTGRGKVWLQSMTIEQLASLIVPYIPSK